MVLECCDQISAFVIYAEADVVYEGRAASTLHRGNYLIIKKEDESIMIHGSKNVPALNYMSGGGSVRIIGDTILASKRSETIIIKIYKCHRFLALVDWSDNKIQITRTEAELTEQIISCPEKYLGAAQWNPYREYQTEAGPIDLVLVSDRIYLIEVKRKKITLKDCYQLQRYLDSFDKSGLVESHDLDPNCPVFGCLAGPDISSNAAEYTDATGIGYLKVQFEV